ncbi:MAG: hypothetical protein N2561_09745 [Bacteroidetes bacterium]|nr:hypothetical protein [Bacteroidota bacterium]
MNTATRNTILLALLWLLISGVGVGLTFWKLPEQLRRRKAEFEQLRRTGGKLEALRIEESQARAYYEQALARWDAQYKFIPVRLSTAEAMAYLNQLTPVGFERFDVRYEGTERIGNVAFHKYSISGEGYFVYLYRFLWNLENSPPLYKVSELQISDHSTIKPDRRSGRERLEVMVKFSLRLWAYFTEAGGLKPPQRRPVLPPEALVPFRAAHNPFYPIILAQVPPNTEDLPDVERSELLGLGRDWVLLRDQHKRLHRLHIGDRVYLGHLLGVDPLAGLAVFQLDRGGIIDRVELDLRSSSVTTRQQTQEEMR